MGSASESSSSMKRMPVLFNHPTDLEASVVRLLGVVESQPLNDYIKSPQTEYKNVVVAISHTTMVSSGVLKQYPSMSAVGDDETRHQANDEWF